MATAYAKNVPEDTHYKYDDASPGMTVCKPTASNEFVIIKADETVTLGGDFTASDSGTFNAALTTAKAAIASVT